MKKHLLLFTAFILIVSTSCLKKVDIEKEKEAILRVLHEEGDAYDVGDLKREFAIYIHDSTVIRLQYNFSSYEIYAGWGAVKKRYENIINDISNYGAKNSIHLKENIIMKVVGNSAWLTCDNIHKYDYQGKSHKVDMLQIAFFEKVNNEWKFSFNAFFPKPVPNTEGQMNTLGYTLLGNGHIKDAITIFKVNVDENPLSSNVYDSYAEALMKDGQSELAIINYRRSLELDSTNYNAKEQIKILESLIKTK
jgi:tetratricopeptide (TPR) repeat protein